MLRGKLVVTIDPGRLAKQVPQAIARGLNEGGDLVRTEVRKALQAQTGLLKYKSVMERTQQAGKGTNRASPGLLRYAIYASSKKTEIWEFPVTNTGHGIDAKTWGVDHLFKRSFEIKGRGPQGYRARRGAQRHPTRKLYGPSLAKELGRDKAEFVFYAGSRAQVPPSILKHLAKLFA